MACEDGQEGTQASEDVVSGGKGSGRSRRA